MRIAIIAPGSRGDIQPYIALGKGLQEAGHGVRIVTNREFEPLVRSYGLECRPVEIDAQNALQNRKTRAAIEGGRLNASFVQLVKIAKRTAFVLTERGHEAAKDADAVLAGFGGLFIGASIAEKLDLPFIQAYNVPMTPTRAFQGALLPKLPFGSAGIFNRLSHRATRQLLWQASRSAGNRARRQVLGLPSAPAIGPYNAGLLGRGPVLYGYSSSVIPKPSDWDAAIEVTGYWFLDAPGDWSPPAALLEFLRIGPPPVYIGFGSMSHSDPQETTNLAMEALRLTGRRAIVLSGWGGLAKNDVSENVFVADSVPHAWLFPRVAAVVHHGGAGTTAAGIRAGIPSIIIPFHGDQPFWGRCVAGLGVGPAPIPRRRLSARSLAAAIEAACTDVEMRRRAADLGGRVRAENGVARAVEALGRLGQR
jgi:UDP:flavonoid glycosyltransferase YjiC (YdhE family)